MRKFISVLAAIGFTLASGFASAAPIVSLVGDQDGFNLGTTHGSSVDYSLINGPAEAGNTDIWDYGSLSHAHSYALPGTIISASLEIFTAGQGLGGLSSLYLNGTLIGSLTDGDDVGPDYNYAWIDTFDLTAYIALLTGSDTFEIRTLSGGDGWSLDYSKLTLTTVPEPASLALLGLGLAGIAVARKRKSA